MKAIKYSGRSISYANFRSAAAFLTGLFFLAFSSCQKFDGGFNSQDLKFEQDLVLTSGVPSDLSDCRTSVIYGPKIFKRRFGEPVIEKLNIKPRNKECYGNDFILKIKNGWDKRSRVSSAEIRIDNVLIAGPSDFSKNVSFIVKQFSGLTSESVLEIKLSGAPGSYIVLWIEGKETIITPVFTQIGPLCQNSIPPEFPLNSTNTPVITGTWSPETINTAVTGKTIYTFTPDEGQCASTAAMEIEVFSSITPAFTQIGPLLQNSTAPELPAVSDNGISGAWSPGTINTTNAGTFTFTFTPAAGQCAIATTMIIEVTNKGVVSDVDGNIYKTVKIGDQWWMAENLKTTKYNNGDLIGTTSPATLDISGESEPKYQWAYNGNEANVNTYGRYYTWYALSDNRGVCPTGWHVPSDAEWTILANYLINNGNGYEGSGVDIAKSLAGTSGWNADAIPGNIGNEQASNNSSGFTALPAGVRNSSGVFHFMGTYASWWSSTEISSTDVWYRRLYSSQNDLGRSNSNKRHGATARCVSDN